jgi:uncharacterized protein YjbI with pentapeptide repeats
MTEQREAAANKFVIAEKAHDLAAAQKSVEDAAAASAGIWLSYLFTLFYLAIAAGGVTHTDLLLETPVKLPFLNVDLPLVAFFALAPALFLITHVYTLVNLALLAAKIGVFNIALESRLRESSTASGEIIIGSAAELGETDKVLRRQLPSNIFVQLLAGPTDTREGGLGVMLQAVAWISLVIGPVLLLLLLQSQFLPFHLAWVTWVHRIMLLIDIILLWLLWPAILECRSHIQLPRFRNGADASLASISVAVVSLLVLGFSVVVARFPGEWIDEIIGRRQWIPANPITALLGATDPSGVPRSTSLHDLFFNGEVDRTTQRRKSLFSNTLVIGSFDMRDTAKATDQKSSGDDRRRSLVLRGRHLEGATLSFADLRKADFTGAWLQGASLWGAQLQGASLDGARLQGALLSNAQLQGASLHGAWLQGASLDHAQLQGASLDSAQLQGASLDGAQLQGADLWLAQFQGATLRFADLRAANLNSANLQGAMLAVANLAGASLFGAELHATDMSGTNIWRTKFKKSSVDASNDSKVSQLLLDDLANVPTSPQDFASLNDKIVKSVPEFNVGGDPVIRLVIENAANPRKRALEKFDILNPDSASPEQSDPAFLEKARVDNGVYKEILAVKLHDLVCSPGKDGSPNQDALFILRGLHRGVFPFNFRISQMNGLRAWTTPTIVEAIISPKAANDCTVSRVLTGDDKDALRVAAAADEGEPAER